MIRHWLSDLKKSAQTSRQSRGGRRRRLCVLEGLEERVLLSGNPTVFKVVNASGNAAMPGSLPFEIQQANANTNTAGSLIEFDKNVFKANTPRTITLAITLALSETDGPEVIDGPGASIVTVSGNNAVGVFQVDNGVTASLSGLTISGGNVASDVENNGDGGGIFNVGTLTVTNSTVENNSAATGGGILSSGKLTVTNSTIEDNTSEEISGGGGIWNGGTLAVTDSTISGNTASHLGSGGGIFNFGDGNDLATLSVTDSTIENNSAAGSGGGIENAGTVTVSQSTIAGNSAGLGGAGIDTEGGALTVTGSTIANNRAARYGGGISIAQTTVLLVNSTIAGNSAVLGGGIAIVSAGSPASLLAVNCTIADNSVSLGGAGAGMYVDAVATTTLENTIVADNTVPVQVSLHPGLPRITLQFTSDIALAAGANNVTGSYNLIGGSGLEVPGTSGGLTNGANGNQVGVNPVLGSLANNGGPTQTMALLAGSPAIDAGNVALAHTTETIDETFTIDGHTYTIVETVHFPLTTDQRGAGFPRTHNGSVDIGAFEVQPEIVLIPPPTRPIRHRHRR